MAKLEELSEHASKEYSLEKSLDLMQADWNELIFEVRTSILVDLHLRYGLLQHMDDMVQNQ